MKRLVLAACVMLSGCVGTVVDTAVGGAVSVAKGGVHVAGAAVGATGHAVSGVLVHHHGKCFVKGIDGSMTPVRC